MRSSALSKRARAYNSPEDRAAVEESGPAGDTAQTEPEVNDPVAELKLLRTMLADQRQALHQSMRAGLDLEKAAEDASAKLAQTQDQLRTSEKELARERLEVERTLASTNDTVGSLKAELSFTEQSLRNVQEKWEGQRRLILRLAPGTGLAVAFVILLLIYRPAAFITQKPAEPSAAARKALPATQAPPNETEAAALERLNHVLARFPRTNVPEVLAAANRLLSSSGSQPCSIEWVGGERAVVVTSRGGAKAPLKAAFARCAGALQDLLNR